MRDNRLLRAGDVWDSTEPLPDKLYQIPIHALESAELRVTRLPFWNDYFIFPLYQTHLIENEKDLREIEDLYGEGFITEEEKDVKLVKVVMGIIGVHRTSYAIIHTRETMIDRYLFNVQCFEFEQPEVAYVTSHPMEALLLMKMGCTNVLSTMHNGITIAQEVWLTRYVSRRVNLINIDNIEPQCLRPPNHRASLHQYSLKFDYQTANQATAKIVDQIKKGAI